MKKISILFILLSISLVSVFAQSPSKSKHTGKKFDVEQFKKQKADFITSKVGLTPTEVTSFIPLMDELFQKKFEINRKLRTESRLLKKKKNPTSEDYDKYIMLSNESELKQAELKREYYEKFKKVLPIEKIYRYQQAENQFMKETINKQRQTKQK